MKKKGTLQDHLKLEYTLWKVMSVGLILFKRDMLL